MTRSGDGKVQKGEGKDRPELEKKILADEYAMTVSSSNAKEKVPSTGRSSGSKDKPQANRERGGDNLAYKSSFFGQHIESHTI